MKRTIFLIGIAIFLLFCSEAETEGERLPKTRLREMTGVILTRPAIKAKIKGKQALNQAESALGLISGLVSQAKALLDTIPTVPPSEQEKEEGGEESADLLKGPDEGEDDQKWTSSGNEIMVMHDPVPVMIEFFIPIDPGLIAVYCIPFNEKSYLDNIEIALKNTEMMSEAAINKKEAVEKFIDSLKKYYQGPSVWTYPSQIESVKNKLDLVYGEAEKNFEEAKICYDDILDWIEKYEAYVEKQEQEQAEKMKKLIKEKPTILKPATQPPERSEKQERIGVRP